MRRFTPLRIGFLGVLTSFALLLGMLAFPSLASAHTASALTPASAHSTNWGGCGECGGGFGFDRGFGFDGGFGGCGDFGFNDDGFDCGGGFGFDNGGFGCGGFEFNGCGGGFGFNNCDFGCGGFGFRHHFFRHHFFRHRFFFPFHRHHRFF